MKNNKIHIFLILFYLFPLIHFNPPPLNENNQYPEIDKLIILSDNNFVYNHISINSKGDMIIDSSSSSSYERKFYGLKKDGTPYFGNSTYKSLNIYSNLGRTRGECLFVNYTIDKHYSNSKEILAYIPQKDTRYIEYYTLDDNSFFIPPYNDIIENIESNRFSAIQIRSDNNLTYVFSYLNNSQLMISQGFFDYENGQLLQITSNFIIDYSKGEMVSCYFTKKNIYVCFYIGENKYKHVSFTIPINDKNQSIEFLHEDTDENELDDTDKNIFYKAIHLKEEYGAFVYFKKHRKDIPRIQIEKSEGLSLTTFIQQVDLNNNNFFNNDEFHNDLIKLNEEQICFVSSENGNKHNLYIIIITINYSVSKSISTKFFGMKMINNYQIYNQIISNLYNNFIVVVFNYNPHPGENYGSCFIILGYPTSEDYSFNIIDKIKINNLPIEKLLFNLTESLNIENNLFNYTFVGTLIINYSEDLKLFLDDTNFERKSIIPKDKNITISFPNKDGIYKKNIFNIEFAYVVQESFSDRLESPALKNFTGKYSNLSFIIEKDICCLDDNCIIFDENTDGFLIQKDNTVNILYFKDKCNSTKQTDYINDIVIYEKESQTYDKDEEISVLPNYISQKSDNIIIKSTNNNFEILNETNSIIEKKNNNCSQDDILSNKCNKEITNEQITQIYSILKDQIKSNKSLIISTERVTFQISSSKEQKINNNPNISSIELGQCETRIKNSRNISDEDSLIIYKIDMKSEDLSSTYVQYEVYDPYTYDIINLEICDDLLINIYAPVTLEENTESIFNSMSDLGYDLFNLNDSFYTDICTTYTTKDGTDLTMKDRKNIIYDKNANISMCQEGCTLINYNASLKKANCDCKVQTESTSTNTGDIKIEKTNVASSFYKTLTNSNFLVLKCYKLIFSKKGQKNNIGSYIMSVVTMIIFIYFLSEFN